MITKLTSLLYRLCRCFFTIQCKHLNHAPCFEQFKCVYCGKWKQWRFRLSKDKDKDIVNLKYRRIKKYLSVCESKSWRITTKQRDEINFLIKYFGAKTNEKEIKEYLDWTVRGKGKPLTKECDNTFFCAKRLLDISVKMWKRDLQEGLISYHELQDDFNCPFFDDLIMTIRKSTTPLPSYSGDTALAAVAFMNSKFSIEREPRAPAK